MKRQGYELLATPIIREINNRQPLPPVEPMETKCKTSFWERFSNLGIYALVISYYFGHYLQLALYVDEFK